MFAVSPTDIDWFRFIRSEGITSNVNFWTPTDWKISKLSRGDKLYFMLKSPIRKIGGYGIFREYKTITTSGAWNEFGLNNGCATKQEMIERLDAYKAKNSTDSKSVEESVIGAIVLDSLVMFDDNEFIKAEEVGIDFSRYIVKIKYFEDVEPVTVETQTTTEPFKPLTLDAQKVKKARIVSERVGQPKFKARVESAYGFKCCVSGDATQELLEAAHIQPYQSSESNHVQNGLLLRVDFHKLFDRGLMHIDNEYVIRISSKVTNEYYRGFDGKRITLPKDENYHPSRGALAERKTDYRP